VVDVLVVLVGADADAITRLKIADLHFAAGSARIFRRTSDRNRRDHLVVVLDDHVLIFDFAQHPDESGCTRLAALLRRILRLTPPAAGISAAATGKSYAATGKSDSDLAETGSAGQQEIDR
jgi:hypothetical protein